jgi:Skp family chaperone for outer membrane proteins
MRAGGRLCRLAGGLGLWLLAAGFAVAQEAPATDAPATTAPVVTAGPVLTLDQDRLFSESAFGKASLDRERAATQALDAENKQIEAALITEEQDLTTRRATLPADEFAALATAFDVKVERIRAEQDAKFRNLSQGREEDRKAFLRAIVPVLGDLMGEKRAVVILEKSTVILSLNAIDVTDEAIARVNAVLPPPDAGASAPPVAPEP